MSKKDYELIASALNTVRETYWADRERATIDAVTEELITRLWQDNPQFKPEKFRQAVKRVWP